MDSFLGISTGHDGQVDGPAQVDQVSIGLILDLHGFRLLILLILGGALVFVLVIILVVAAFAENLSLELLVRIFVLFPF
jgi:hypothetical protein